MTWWLFRCSCPWAGCCGCCCCGGACGCCCCGGCGCDVGGGPCCPEALGAGGSGGGSAAADPTRPAATGVAAIGGPSPELAGWVLSHSGGVCGGSKATEARSSSISARASASTSSMSGPALKTGGAIPHSAVGLQHSGLVGRWLPPLLVRLLRLQRRGSAAGRRTRVHFFPLINAAHISPTPTHPGRLRPAQLDGSLGAARAVFCRFALPPWTSPLLRSRSICSNWSSTAAEEPTRRSRRASL